MACVQSMPSCVDWSSSAAACCSRSNSRSPRSFSRDREACCGIGEARGGGRGGGGDDRDRRTDWKEGMSATSSGKRAKKSPPMVHALMSAIRCSNMGDIWYWPVTTLFL